MFFLRSKGSIILTIIMCGLCLTAIGISIRVSNTAIERKQQVIKNELTENPKQDSAPGEQINLNKLSELTLYFNGQKLDGLNAYLTDKRQCLVPIDEVLEQIKQNFKYYSSDDIVISSYRDNKLLLKLGKNTAQLGSKEIVLPACPVAAKGHILVPVELLNNLDGLLSEFNISKNTLFVDYYPDIMDKPNSNVKVLRLINSIAGISDIFSKKLFWDRQGKYESYEKYVSSNNGSSSILRSGNDLYIINYGNSFSPHKVNVNSSASISTDGKYLYWIDSNAKSSFLYNIGTGVTKKLPDFFSGNNSGYIYNTIFDYKEGRNYRRIAFTNQASTDIYSVIERNSKQVIKGIASLSPDKYKVLFNKPDQGYYVANSDGSGITPIGQGVNAYWINNNRILLQTQSGSYMLNNTGRNKTDTGSTWMMVGQTSKDDVLYTRDNSLYKETDGQEKFIADLPGTCYYAYAISSGGPYIAACQGPADGIYYISGNNVINAGKYSLLLNNIDREGVHIDYKDSFSISPDHLNTVIFQRENEFITLNLLTENGSKQRSVVLNWDSSNSSGTVKSKWITNDRLLIYSSAKGWVIDFKNDIKIYYWTEDIHSSIEGVIP